MVISHAFRNDNFRIFETFKQSRGILDKTCIPSKLSTAKFSAIQLFVLIKKTEVLLLQA